MERPVRTGQSVHILGHNSSQLRDKTPQVGVAIQRAFLKRFAVVRVVLVGFVSQTVVSINQSLQTFRQRAVIALDGQGGLFVRGGQQVDRDTFDHSRQGVRSAGDQESTTQRPSAEQNFGILTTLNRIQLELWCGAITQKVHHQISTSTGHITGQGQSPGGQPTNIDQTGLDRRPAGIYFFNQRFQGV